jgi:hypothetical protein
MHRRYYERFTANELATVNINNEREQTFILQNISGCGAGIIGYYPLKPRDKVSLSVQIPLFPEEILKKEGRVVWSRNIAAGKWEAGLDFRYVPAELP